MCRNTSDADGPDRWAGRVYAFVLFWPFSLFGYLVALLMDCPKSLLLPFALSSGAGAAIVARRAILALARNTGQAFALFVAPSGSTTPYVPSFSYEDSLVARGNVAAALNAYNERLLRSPNDVGSHIRAADLCVKSGDPKRAAELYRRARALPGVSPESEVYATHRLIDLYRGTLDDEGRALVELRRLVERFPGTDVAAGARTAILRIKSPNLST